MKKVKIKFSLFDWFLIEKYIKLHEKYPDRLPFKERKCLKTFKKEFSKISEVDKQFLVNKYKDQIKETE